MHRLAPLLLGFFLLTGCTGKVLEDATAYELLNRQHAADTSLPVQAREIAQDNADGWAYVRWELGGPEPDAATVARVESRS